VNLTPNNLIVHCLDRLPEPDKEFQVAQLRSDRLDGSLRYRQVDVRDATALEGTMSDIASDKDRVDGVIAAAGVNHLASAMDHTAEDIGRVMSINYNGAFNTAIAAAKQMRLRKSPGSILFVASMSGLIANKGMFSPVYNSSKAAVVQLARSLAMEWGKADAEGSCPIRVNSLCPGHIATPMAQMVIDQSPGTKEIWESENMLGRLAEPHEFGAAAVFLLSEASSFMTGSTMVVDGGHTAW